MMERDIRLAANACPKCFKKLDAATCVEKDRLPGWRPEPGVSRYASIAARS